MYRFEIKILSLFFIILSLSSCVTFAPPSPMLTYGGPETTPKKSSEVALGFGSAGVQFKGAHNPSQGWFGRYKYGLNDKFDIGIDVIGAVRNEGQYFGVKSAVRYQLSKYSRIELGVGAADDSDGKSLNGDIAYTMGTVRNKPWNYYFSLRHGYAHGYPGNVAFADNSSISQADTITPPNTHFALLNFGTQAQVNTNIKFIVEAGYGHIYPKSKKSGRMFIISAGCLFTIGE